MMTAAGGKQRSRAVDDRWQWRAEQRGYESEKAMLEGMYKKLKSLERVGRELGKTSATIRNRCKKWGIKRGPKGGARKKKQDVPTTQPFKCKKCGDQLYGEQKKVGLCVYHDPSIGVVAREVEDARVRY